MPQVSAGRWSATSLVRTRPRRLVLLGASVGGWVLLAAGVVTGSDAVVLCGAVAVGVSAAVVTKLTFEGRSAIGAATTQLHDAAPTASKVDDLTRAAERMHADVARLTDDIARCSDDIARCSDDIARCSEDARRDTSQLAGLAAELRRLAVTAEATRAGLGTARELLDKVAVRTPSRVSGERVAALAVTNVADPLLSIAIPSFNRPAALGECLRSIAAELAGTPEGLVEVCITDDASTDPETLEVAADFAESFRFSSLRLQSSNVGLERNVLASCEPCRGRHVLILGNDDKFVPGALATVLEDLRRFDPSVYVFGRQRIHVDGSAHPAVPGTDPIELPPGGGHLFATLLEATSRQGVLSTLGFSSHVVCRRQPFVAVDATRYLDLTLYARVFVLIEAFASERLFFRNAPVVFHRTPSTAQKHVEAVGRGEEVFMAGGPGRAARYFGTTFAAALQRLVDRGVVDHAYLAKVPEALMTPEALVHWIAANRALDPTIDAGLDASVVTDADRFFAALGALTLAR